MNVIILFTHVGPKLAGNITKQSYFSFLKDKNKASYDVFKLSG